jgi:hypothetical protein
MAASSTSAVTACPGSMKSIPNVRGTSRRIARVLIGRSCSAPHQVAPEAAPIVSVDRPLYKRPS